MLVVGILIQLAALFGEHATEIPFVLRIIAPGWRILFAFESPRLRAAQAER
jgi:hypothetical protein